MARIDRTVARRVVRKLEAAARDPARTLQRLVGADERKLRIGDYRLLALLSHDSKTILVERVAHRSIVYKR